MAMNGYRLTADEDLLYAFSNLRSVFAERDARHNKVNRVLRREWDLKDSEGSPLDIASSNMVLTALEDISEASATMPTIRVRPSKQTQVAIDEAKKMELIANSYATANKFRPQLPRWAMDHLAYGLTAYVVLPSQEQNRPMVYKRNARTCFPDMPVYPSMIPRRVMFSERVRYKSLEKDLQNKLTEVGYPPPKNNSETTLVRVEHIDDEEYIVGYMWSANRHYSNTDDLVTASWTPWIEERYPVGTESTPVVIVARSTFDDEHRGLFDHVLDPQLAHAKLLAMAIDYADQAVYSDTWARNVLGEVPLGGGSFIELGPDGAIGKVPPAASSLDLWRDVDKLEEGIHLGARWPKSRPGQVDQSIASGKFVEATVGTMNTVLKVVHEKFAEGMEALLHLMFQTDLEYFGGMEQEARGQIHGEDFMVDYVPDKDIHMYHDINVEYGLGLGRDPSESAVLMLQYAERGLLSNEFVQENTEGLTDVQREKLRVELETLSDMMNASLMQSIEAGEIPKSVLAEIYRRREAGDDMVTIIEDLFAPTEQPGLGEVTGLPGEGMGGPMGGPPGVPGLPPGMAPGILPPPPPEAGQLLARLNVPGGPGGGPAESTLGAQVQIPG